MTFESTIESVVRTVVREELRVALGTSKPSEYLSLRDAAKRAGVSAATVRRWVKDGKVPRYGEGRIVRVKWADVEAAMAKGEPPATEEDIAGGVMLFSSRSAAKKCAGGAKVRSMVESRPGDVVLSREEVVSAVALVDAALGTSNPALSDARLNELRALLRGG